jgi:hypothetical protein
MARVGAPRASMSRRAHRSHSASPASLVSRDDAMATIEQLSAASFEPIEHLRNYVLCGVLTCDDRGMFALRASMLAIVDFWDWRSRS